MRALVLLALGLSCAACHPLDRRAPFARPGYVRSHGRVVQAADRAPHATGAYRAGWARVPVRAPEGVPLAGYGDRDGAPSEGVRDPVHVRAFAIGAGELTAVVFTADLLLLSPRVVDTVRARLADRIDGDAVFFSASHTHSGPGAFVDGLVWQAVMGDFDERAVEAVVSAHVEAARAALDDLGPARIGAVTRSVAGLMMNRVEKNGPIDDGLLLVAFDKGDRKAALWAYGCHPVTLPPENMRQSADYPGMVAARFEGQGLEALGFAAGGVGSANPKHERPHDQAWIVEPLTRAVQSSLTEALRAARPSGPLAFAHVRVPRPRVQYRVDTDLALWSTPIAKVVNMPTLDFGAVAIGNTVLLHMPAEMSGSLTRAARARAAKSGVRLQILPFNGTYLGYVVPRRVYDLPEDAGEEMLPYETKVVSFLGPWGADYLMNLGLSLAGGVYAKTQARSDPAFDWVVDSASSSTPVAARPGETETSYANAGSSN